MVMLSRFLLLLVVIAIVVVGFWWYQQQGGEADESVSRLIPEEPPPARPRHPVPQPEPETRPEFEPLAAIEMEEQPRPEPAEPLPPLDESDETVFDALTEPYGREFLDDWLVSERIIERSVVFINSLDGPAIPLRLRPASPVPGDPLIDEDADGESGVWNPANAQRYEPLVRSLQATGPQEAAEFYFRFYPLLQEAHAELASSERYFNDRLVDVIDHLLDTPEIPAEFEVEPWEGHYRFADPAMEELSWGRKMLVRMGPEQAAVVKGWLRDFREQVAGAQPDSD